MSQPVIVIGDQTSHGGVVIESSAVTDTHGKRIARVGDRVTCPKKGHGGTTVIVTGDPTFIIDGRPVARHGDRTACGAVLIATQAVTTTSSDSAPAQRADASAAAESPLPKTDAAFTYDEQVQLVVASGEAPLAGLAWFIEAEDGRTFSGTLGADGQMPRVDTAVEGRYSVYWGDEARARTEGVA